jgi:glutathione S-transferase
MNTRPILWHIEISHYNEKARWALDLKGVEHERRALVPGYHMAVALALTRGRCYTSPILELDGRRIGDSTAIIRALEERYPQPPLYPTEPGERRRALELEDFFDEELGPYIRRLLFHDLHSDRAAAARLAAQVSPPPSAVGADRPPADACCSSRASTRSAATLASAEAKQVPVRPPFRALQGASQDGRDARRGAEAGASRATRDLARASGRSGRRLPRSLAKQHSAASWCFPLQE